MNKLRIVSYLAPNFFEFYQAIAQFLERTLGIPTSIEQSAVDPLVDSRLMHDQIDLSFLCGLPFAQYCQQVPGQLEAIVAPVMQADRYQNQPVYFADVIVPAASPITNFEQLSGLVFCYNDRGSNSGYNLMRDRLRKGHYPPDFFGDVRQSGSHQQSMQWVATGKADCAAIDSTMLEQECRCSSVLASQLRIIELIGPCPMPPIVAASRLGNSILNSLRQAFLHPDKELQQQMQQVGIRRFTAVCSHDYDEIVHLYNTNLRAGYATLEPR